VGVLLELFARRSEIIRSAVLLAFAVGFGAFAETPGSAPPATTAAIGNGFANPANPAVLDRAREPLKPTGPGEPVPIGNPLWAIPLSSLSAVRERPIFSPSRRPPPPAIVAAPYVPPANPPPPKPPVPDHPPLTLLGTVAGETQGIGIFINQIDKTPMHLKTGEGHEGWFSVRSADGR
jgi:general secretion pathway protein N